jgi:hypothetical protein
MSQYIVYRIARINNKNILNLFEQFEKDMGSINNKSVNVLGVSVTDAEEIKKLKDNSHSINAVSMTTENHKYTILFYRGISITSENPHPRQASQYFDEIFIQPGRTQSGQQQTPTKEDALKLSQLIEKNKNITLITDSATNEANDVMSILKAEMGALSTLHQDMIAGVEKQRLKLNSDYEGKQKDLEKLQKQKLDEIDQLKKEEKEKLKAERQTLEDRAKELDDRDYMFVRRELRENINTTIADKLNHTIVSRSARLSKFLVTFLILGASAFLAALSYIGFQEIIAKPTTITTNGNIQIGSRGERTVSDFSLWFVIIKTFFSSIGAIGFLMYGVGWLKKLYYDEVNSRRELERYTYDINRASWIIETVMEMKSQQNSADVPDVWIQSVCNNLFNDINHDDDHEHNSALSALLGASSSVKFGTDGFNFDINKHGAKRLSKKV